MFLARNKSFSDRKSLDLKPKSTHYLDFDTCKISFVFLQTIEPFFSREVTTVITDAPESRLKTAQASAAATKEKLGGLANHPVHFAPSPSTSVGGTPGGGLNNKNSPDFQTWSPLSVQDQNIQNQKFFQAKSRVETILEKAKQQITAKQEKSNTCDVIDSAQKLGIQVWLLPKIHIWIDQLKEKIGNFDKLGQKNPNIIQQQQQINKKRKRSAFEQADIETRELKTPFIKYDDVTHECRPVFCEFRKFPRIYCGGRAGQSPFFSPEASFVRTQKLREFPERKLAEKTAHQQLLQRKLTPVTTSVQQQHQKLPPTTTVQQQQQQQIQQHQHKAAHLPAQKEKKVHNKGPQQTQGGYCEICEAPFSELEGHIVSKVHIARVGLSHLWSKLDTCIDQV